MITAAVAANLPEADDLDWKSGRPAERKFEDDEFPKDVAAMANIGGGVIVYGVVAKGKKATGRNDAGELSDAHERALVTAAWTIRPPVLKLDFIEVGEEPTRAIVVVVPASTEGPHLIFRNRFFAAPIRTGAATEWMTERQIESAYRARMDERRRSAERLSELYDEAASNWSWDDTGRAVIVAAALPRLPIVGAARPERQAAAGMFADALGWASTFAKTTHVHPLESVDRYNPRPGLRRWIAPNKSTGVSAWKESWAAIHHDGSVTLTATIGGHRLPEGHHEPSQMEATAVENAVADFAGLVIAVASEHGLGEYDVRIGIEWLDHAEPLLIYGQDGSGFLYGDNSIALFKYTPVLTTIVADAGIPDLKRQVYALAEDCINQGGITIVRQIELPAEGEV